MSACLLCKKPLSEDTIESWFTPNGQAVEICRSELPSIVAETSMGEVEMCELCYRGGLPSYFTGKDASEIHYQFGLEYRDRDERSRSAEALTNARQLHETADVLAALAYAEDQLGRRDVAVTLYQRALEIDSNHFMARENLNIIRGDEA